jgi:hypothetical protein
MKVKDFKILYASQVLKNVTVTTKGKPKVALRRKFVRRAIKGKTKDT